jgi:alpha-L-arabinofuranosidase
LAVWDGLALNGDITPEDELDPYVQSALDEIEFLRGDVTTKWGAVRASLGYPEGWDISIVEVGNEDWLAGAPAGWQTYKDYRLPMFLDAINAKYPDILVLASGSVFDNITIPAPAGGDRHDYQTPDGFQEAFNFFDQLGPENLTLIGESATVHPNGGIAWNGPLQPFPWWGGAVAEAIYLIGAERNSPRVIGATYAPMLRNMNRWQWAVTLLQHAADPKLTTRSTSFYVWKVLIT